MSNNEVTRNKLSFEERAKYFKKRVEEFFTSYKNESGGEDCIEVCLIREGRRAVIMAEEEINRQKAENTSLSKEIINAKIEMYEQCIKEMINKIVNTPFSVNRTGKTNEYQYGYSDGLVDKQNHILNMLNNLLKELVGEDMQNERDRLIALLKNKYDCLCDQCGINKEVIYSKNLADYLLANGVIVPPCKVGDTVWFLLEDEFPVHKWFLSEEKITEVASKGFFTSSFAEPCGTEDFGNYTAYSEVGKEAFFNKPEAEAKLKEMDKLAGKSNMGSTCE